MQTAVTMRQVTGGMAGVVKGMEGAMKAMGVEQVGGFKAPFLYLDSNLIPRVSLQLQTCMADSIQLLSVLRYRP